METSTISVIETHGLAKTYKGVQALKSLNLQVQQNTICRTVLPTVHTNPGSQQGVSYKYAFMICRAASTR